MTVLSETDARFVACPSHAFRVDFGVYRGEAIGHLDELNLGDVYQLKSDTTWTSVNSDNDTTSFSMDLAANLPNQNLTTLAQLIFMTTEGRRADVYFAVADGRPHLVCDAELKVGPEYVLIDIRMRDVDFTPVIVPEPATPQLPVRHAQNNVIPLRAVG